MGYERVLNEDKAAHSDEGMAGIMREMKSTGPSRAEAIVLRVTLSDLRMAIGVWVKWFGFRGDKSAKGTFRCDGAERLSEQMTALPSTRCPPGKVIKGLDWPGWSSRRGRRHIHTFAIPAMVAEGSKR